MANTVTARAVAWGDGVTVSGAEMRAATLGGLVWGPGIQRGLTCVQIPTPAQKVRLGAGLCFISDGQNGYFPLELATQTDLDVAAAHATLPRIDSVIAEVVDVGTSSTIRQFRVVTGTAASSPVAPTLPDAINPSGKTLRLFNVAVGAAVTTIVNANISQQALSIGLVSRPAEIQQAVDMVDTDFTAFSTWTDVPSGRIGTLSFVVPPSGSVYITLGSYLHNQNTTSSVIHLSYRGSGGGFATGTGSPQIDQRNIGNSPGGRGIGSRRRLFTGLTPGATVTLTPVYFASSATSSGQGTFIKNSNILVEAVA